MQIVTYLSYIKGNKTMGQTGHTEHTEYVHLIDTVTNFEDKYYGDWYHEPWVSLTLEDEKVHYNKRFNGYLRFDVLTDGQIKWTSSDTAITRTIEYSVNGGKWVEITSTTGGTAIDVSAGDTVFLRGSNRQYAEVIDRGYIYPETGILDIYNNNNVRTVSFSGTTCQVNLAGNVLSMIYRNGFRKRSSLPGECNFYGMFNMGNVLKSIDGLSLPATRITEGCYAYMLKGGDYTTPVNLPARKVKEACYRNIFADSKITSVPELGALNTAKYAFSGMFARTNVSTVPSDYLSFTTDLSLGCYDSMFRGCQQLTTFPVLPATTVPQKGYNQMFENCVKLTTAPELPATTLGDTCYYGMFKGCTGLTVAPDLPAPTLVHSCYQEMFRNCTNLNYIRCLATDISAENCVLFWVQNVAPSGTFVKPASMTGWRIDDISGIPIGWTVEDAS